MEVGGYRRKEKPDSFSSNRHSSVISHAALIV
jgi:hypothetical protein